MEKTMAGPRRTTSRKPRHRPALASVLVAAALGGMPAPARAFGNPYPGYVSPIYSNRANWLCRPDKDDVCDHDLDATQVKGSGQTRIEHWRPARRPTFDCFYVYPTISLDPGGNSDLIPQDNQELFVVRQQAARLGSVCRVFAPIYRQVTLTALVSILSGNPIPTDSALADADLLDAWKQYIANDNGGRGVLLIGHSQGSSRLTTLIKNEIDGNPDLRGRLVSAMLAGTNLQVPVGADVGGDFANIPLCHSRHDVGCVMSWASFRSTAPPPPDSLFGRSFQPGMKAACTNPASLANRKAPLHGYFPSDGATLPLLPPSHPQWAPGLLVLTPFVTVPGLVDGECVEKNGFSYLELTINGNPADPRIDDIGGDPPAVPRNFGMHLVDVNVAMGDLVTIARSQGRAFRRLH